MTELRQRQPREVDEKHLNRVRWLQCVLHEGIVDGSNSCWGVVAAHHVKTKGTLGGDKQTIPLCAKHHSELHDSGRMTFATRYGLDYEQLIRETNEKVK